MDGGFNTVESVAYTYDVNISSIKTSADCGDKTEKGPGANQRDI